MLLVGMACVLKVNQDTMDEHCKGSGRERGSRTGTRSENRHQELEVSWSYYAHRGQEQSCWTGSLPPPALLSPILHSWCFHSHPFMTWSKVSDIHNKSSDLISSTPLSNLYSKEKIGKFWLGGANRERRGNGSNQPEKVAVIVTWA